MIDSNDVVISPLTFGKKYLLVWRMCEVNMDHQVAPNGILGEFFVWSAFL